MSRSYTGSNNLHTFQEEHLNWEADTLSDATTNYTNVKIEDTDLIELLQTEQYRNFKPELGHINPASDVSIS